MLKLKALKDIPLYLHVKIIGFSIAAVFGINAFLLVLGRSLAVLITPSI